MLKNLIALALSGVAFHAGAAQNYYVVTPLTAETVAKGSISLSPSDLQFGGVTVGTHSAQLVEIRNTGNKPQALHDISITQNSDEFSVSHSCPASLSAGASCSATVVYAPQLTTHVGTLTVKSSPAGNKVLALQGSRLLTPAKLAGGNEQDFGNLWVGDTATRTWTLKNSGHEAAALTYGALPVGMVNSGTCGASLAGGASCTVILTWTPTAAGSLDSTTYTVGDQNLALTGTAVAKTYTGAINAGSLDFGSLVMGGSGTQAITLTNTGNQALTLPESVGAGIAAPYSVWDNCETTLAPGASCTATVSYNPTVPGTYAQVLTINMGAAGDKRVSLAGSAYASFNIQDVQSYNRYESYSDNNGYNYSDAATEIRATASSGVITGIRVVSGRPVHSQGTYHLQWFRSGAQNQIIVALQSDYNCVSYTTGTMTFEVTGSAGSTQFSAPYWIGCDGGGDGYLNTSGYTYMGYIQ